MKKSNHPALIVITLAGLVLSACSADDFVSPAEDTAPKAATKSNIKSRDASDIAPERILGRADESDTPASLQEGDESVAAVLRAAEKMRAKKDYVSASVLYKRAVGENPESVAALRGLAEISELRGQPQEAIAAWRDIIRQDEENILARRGLARNFTTLGIHDKAIGELEAIRKIQGENADILNLLGMAYTRKGDLDNAITHFKYSLDLDPTLKTQNNLGFAYILNGQITDAIRVLEKVCESTQATTQYRQNLALAYGLAGREADARAISLQDLPRAAVEKNLKTYRAMRAKALGKPVVLDLEPATPEKPKTAVKKEEKKEAKKPVKKGEPKKVTAPKVEVKKEEAASTPAAAPAPVVETAPTAPSPAPTPPAPVPPPAEAAPTPTPSPAVPETPKAP